MYVLRNRSKYIDELIKKMNDFFNPCHEYAKESRRKVTYLRPGSPYIG